MRTTIFILALSLFSVNLIFSQPCYKELSAGVAHTVALKADNTLWIWGANNHYQLGNGTVVNSSNPTQIGSDNNWSKISAGLYWTLAIKNDGTLWAWGQNIKGQLGNGTVTYITYPTQIGTDTNWQHIATGSVTSFGIKTDGTLWGWGDNVNGILGDGTSIPRLTPVQIGSSNNWSTIDAFYHCSAIKTDGSLWSWGINNFGQVDGTFDDVSTPTQVGTETDWAQIEVNGMGNTAIKSDGTIWTWGSDYYGGLGNGSFLDSVVPTQIATGSIFLKVASGLGHTVALKSDGTIWTWGLNNHGQIGNGTIDTSFPDNSVVLPTQIGTDTNWTEIEAGYNTTFASKNDSDWAWGDNALGLLGNGQTSGNSTIPSQIINCNFLSVGNVTEKTIKIYPNPTDKVLNIDSNNTLIQKLELYNVQAKLILSQVLTIPKSLHQLDISHLSRGTYVLKIITSDEVKESIILKN